MIVCQQAEPETVLAEIVRNSDDAILGKTLDAVITSWNPAAERMYGYTAEEAIGRPVSMLLPPEGYQDLEMIMARVSSGVGVRHYDTMRKHKGGHALHVSLTVSPIRNKLGQIVGASTIARDITAIHQAEDALRGADKLAALGRMAASIAHEIRNPLEVAKNLAYILVHDQAPESSHRELLATLEDQLRHMSEISNRTLSFARQVTSLATVSIAAILDETLALMRTNLMAKHVTIDRRFDSSGEVVGYAGPLRQLIVNLVANATDALPLNGGRITLHVADVHNPATGIPGVRLLVGDNGTGIPRAHRSKLFCQFFSTKQDNGTGLGLWVCSGIVTQHGGSIRFRTRSNGTRTGTCFSAFLPKLNVAEMQKTA
jgi:two-component system CheB/CheR fusion protein